MFGTLQHVLTVTELTVLIRDRLEQVFPDLWLEGEISNLRTPASGHLYFTLKDHVSQIRAVLFRAGAVRLRFALREGLQIVARGRLTVYEPRGEYQIALDYVEPKGVGALQLAFEQLKDKLAREGLFDPSRKRPLPLLPKCVGIVTSVSGAAIRDMLTILQRRCPGLAIRIHPVSVQGDGAAHQIAAAIRELGQSGDVDVLIVGRGGGSWEDLWSFNEEVVVRAIAASPVPVVSAVGHETDVTLADFAADVRAPTPSAAAEAVAPVVQDLMRAVREIADRHERSIRHLLASIERRVIGRCEAMPILFVRLLRQGQRVDEVVDRLHRALTNRLSHLRQRVRQDRHDLLVCSPRNTIRGASVLIPQLLKRLEEGTGRILASQRDRLRAVVGALNSLSPLAVLTRGYGIVQRASDGAVVRRMSDVSVGERVQARLAEGRLLCLVESITPDSERLT